ncbi:MAG: hypothetical protein ACXVAA_10535, partial [Candidatus Binataceae bacterium]
AVAVAAIVARRMRAQTVYQPEFEDWLFHIVLPLAAYAMLALSAFAALAHTREALFGVGAATLLLLFVGIHNAWDSITYTYLGDVPVSVESRSLSDLLWKHERTLLPLASNVTHDDPPTVARGHLAIGAQILDIGGHHRWQGPRCRRSTESPEARGGRS